MKRKIISVRKRYAFCVFLCLFLSFTFGSLLAAKQLTDSSLKSLVVSVPLSKSDDLSEIIGRGFTILEINRSRDFVIILVSPQEFTWLSIQGFSPMKVPNEIAQERGWMYSALFERDFHSYTQMTSALQDIATTYPSITRLYSLGQSVQGRTIWGLKITDNPDVEENEPEVRICGLHHGNEYMSGELPLLLAYHLVQNYTINPEITALVNNREIWIIPMVNPDGREAGTRTNAHGVDLNRNYGYMPQSATPYSEPETQAMRNNALQNNFVLSLSFHCSGDIVNYIWNYKTQRSPDNAAIVYLSNQYASHNSYWVTEGYDWYQTLGDCNDFSYGCRGDIDWTIEVQTSNIPQAWNLNRDAMLGIIDAANMGITGVVTNANTGEPIPATIWVQEAFWPCFADPIVGDYHRVLLPGAYTVHYRANGFEDKTFSVQVTSGEPTALNVALNPAAHYYAYQITTCKYYAPSNNYQNNPTEGISSLGPPDGICASLGVGGYIIVDMFDPLIDVEDEPDLKVYEGGPTSDGYAVYVSSAWNGPWVFLGNGMGTAEFDLANGAVDSARYVKIVDDGDGSPSELNPGVDIDAIENLAAANANKPPENPAQPQGPIAGATNNDYTYSTLTTDPESQSVYYLWSWGDGSQSQWIGPFDSGESTEVSHCWISAGSYTVQVKAKDALGLESGWSPPLSVLITDAPCLEIGQITGGVGITAQVVNTGVVEASDVAWSIVIEGGVVLLGRTTTGTLPKIQPGFSPEIRTGFLLGIGKTTVTVTAGVAEKTVQAILLGPFVFIQK